MATISSTCGGEVHSSTAANSDPPPKFSPVMRGTSTGLNPFWDAWDPRTSAKGTKPTMTGNDARNPRKTSGRARSAQEFPALKFRFFVVQKD